MLSRPPLFFFSFACVCMYRRVCPLLLINVRWWLDYWVIFNGIVLFNFFVGCCCEVSNLFFPFSHLRVKDWTLYPSLAYFLVLFCCFGDVIFEGVVFCFYWLFRRVVSFPDVIVTSFSQWYLFHQYKLFVGFVLFMVYIPLYSFLCLSETIMCVLWFPFWLCVFVEDLYPLTKPSKNSGVTMNWWFRSCRRIDFRARRDTTSVRSHFNNGTLKSLQSGTCYNRVELEVPAINLPKFAFRLLT